MTYKLPSLNYEYNALEPYIDEKTMQIHHTKHHQAYVDNLNNILSVNPDISQLKQEILLSRINIIDLPQTEKIKIINHGGGHLNHSFFWKILDPKNSPDKKLLEEISSSFGSVEKFKNDFQNAALSHFGSGWAWLIRTPENKLNIYSTPNQESPYTRGDTPLIGLDVWEHAYYLKYQNRRAEYISNFWKVLKIV